MINFEEDAMQHVSMKRDNMIYFEEDAMQHVLF